MDSEHQGMLTSEAFKKAVNVAPIGIYEIDFDGSKFRYTNPRFAEALGYSVEEILAKKPLDLLSDNSKKKFEYATKIISQERRTSLSDEFEAVGKNGKKMWGLSRVIVNYRQGKPDSLLVFAQDITERKRLEESLQLSEEKFSKAFSNSPFAVSLTCLGDGKIVEANESAASLFGFKREEVIGRTTVELQMWANPEDRHKFIQDLASSGNIKNRELSFRKRDGAIFLVLLSASMIEIQGEKHFISTFVDITERKETESAFRESEARFHSLFDNSLDAILLTVPDGTILSANLAAERLFGMTEQEIKISGRKDILVLDERAKAAIDKRAKTGKAVAELTFRRKDGSTFEGEVSSSFFVDADGLTKTSMIIRDISARKKAEEALKESEELFSKSFKFSPFAMAISNIDQQMVDVNPVFEKLTGFSRDEIIGKSPSDLSLYTSMIEQSRIDRSLEETGQVSNYELTLKQKSGNHIIVLISIERIYLHGKPHLLGTLVDITERKKAEEKLAENERLYRTLFDNSKDGFMLLEPVFDKEGKACDFRFLKLNAAYEQQTGAKADDVLGKLASDVTPELESDYVLLSGKVAKTGDPVHYEAYNKYSSKWYDSYFFPYSEGQVGILFRDITERKKTEALLKESQKKYRDLIETNYDFIWEIDAQGRYTYCSPQMEKLWGLKPAEMIGQSFFDLLPPGEKERVMEFFKGMTSSPKPLTGLQTTSYDRQGRLVYIETNGVPFADEQGRFLGFRGISRDVTERKKAEEALRNNERLATIGQTAGMVGHDIRNPLQAVMGETYLLKEELASKPESKEKEALSESVDMIEKNAVYINKIVQDLQDYARPITPEIKEANLSDIFVSVFETVRLPDTIKLNISIHDTEKIRTDPMLLQRALTNLVNNAIQAMPNGGELKITGQPNGTRLVITVADTGTGIPEEIKPKLFTPMMTTKAKGQGFGLAVSKRLIEAMKGTISFESEKGKGTKFIIELRIIQ